MVWPPQNPDLNNSELVWDNMNKQKYSLNPQKNYDTFSTCQTEKLRTIRRTAAVYKAKDGHTNWLSVFCLLYFMTITDWFKKYIDVISFEYILILFLVPMTSLYSKYTDGRLL